MGGGGPPHAVPERYSRRPAAMRFTVIAVLCAGVVLAAGDGHLRAKSKLLGRLAAKIKHHKRGVFSSAPPYKYGHDIPHVTHSIVKPIVVSYPPTASVTAVKVPLYHPLIPKYPGHVGHNHKAPLLPHYAHRFPHHTHTKVVPRPDQHFHHHHHHVAPRPVVPILPAHTVPAAPVIPTLPVPIPQPSVIIPRPIPAPSPAVAPIIPATPQFILPQNHVHLKPVLPAPVPVQHSPIAPLYPYAPQYSYAIRPGNAVQTSYFATYPRYPLGVSIQQSLVPLARPAIHVSPSAVPLAPSVASAGPVLLERPQEPHYHVLQQPHAHGVVEQPTPAVAVQPTFLHPTQAAIPQPTVHLQPAQPAVHVDHNGWAPVPHGHDLTPVHQDGHHFVQPDLVPTQETHFAQPHDHFTQEQGQQVYEHHTGEEAYHEYQHQLQHHIQQQLEQAQYEQNLHNHQLAHEYGQPNVDYSQQNHDFSQQDFAQHAHEYAQHGQDFSQHHGQDFSQHQGQDFSQHQGQDFSQHQGQDFSHHHGQDFLHHQQDFSQHGQDFSHHQQDFSQHGQDFSHHQQDFSQHGQDFSQHGDVQPQQEYGVPQQHVLEGRSEEGAGAGAEEEPQRFHNHIPLGLQPPLDRPLDHFR